MDLEVRHFYRGSQSIELEKCKSPCCFFFLKKKKKTKNKQTTSHRRVKEINVKGHYGCMECLLRLDFPSLNFMPLFSCLFVPY